MADHHEIILWDKDFMIYLIAFSGDFILILIYAKLFAALLFYAKLFVS